MGEIPISPGEKGASGLTAVLTLMDEGDYAAAFDKLGLSPRGFHRQGGRKKAS